MRIHLYTFCWNEADMLGFFFRHYDPWVDRYVVFDDGSKDGSIELLDAHPRVERRRVPRRTRTRLQKSFVLTQQTVQNEAWKESRGDADWAVVTAIDEHLWCPHEPVPDLLSRLADEGVTAVPALGYEMLSKEFPGPEELLCRTRTLGAPSAHMSKLSIFRPDALTETCFGIGRHRAAATGNVVYPQRDELLLLHYKYVGFDRVLRRHAMYQSGLGKGDKLRDLGSHYWWDEARVQAEREAIAARAVNVAAIGPDPHTAFPDARWWRPTLQAQAFASWGKENPARMRDVLHPHCELVVPDSVPYGGTFRGTEAVIDWFTRELWRWFDEFTSTPEGLIDGGDQIVVPVHVQARARNGKTMDVHNVWICEFSDGKLIRGRVYADTAVLRDTVEGVTPA